MCSVPICRVLEMESLLTSLRCVKQRCGRLSSCTIREFFIVIFDLTLHVFDWEQLGDEIILLWKKKLIKQELELR